MRKYAAMSIIFCLALFAFISCEKAGAPKAGTATPEDMLSLVPIDVQGVFFIDAHRVMTTEFANKLITEDEGYQKLQEFIENTGIDPQKDIYFITVALTEEIGLDTTKDKEAASEKGVAIINMKHDKDTLLPLIKEKVQEEEQELMEEEYNGFTIYSLWEEKNEMSFAFIDDSNIVGGGKNGVKSIIDVLQNKKDNVYKNESLSPLLEKTNKDAMLWAAMLISQKTVDELTTGNPMLSDLEGLNALSLYFDYKNKNIIAEIKILGGDETKNKQIAELLTGFKALGALAAGEKPEVGELMNRIEVTSGTDHVKLYASLPEDLINKLKEKKEEEKEEEN